MSTANGLSSGDYIDTYSFDLAGNRIQKLHDVNGDGINSSADLTSTFYYGLPDASGHVASEDGNDLLIEEKDVTSGSNPVTTTTIYGHTDLNGVFHAGYDANGFNVEKHITGGNIEDDIYVADLRGRLASATVKGQTTTEKYDTSGTIIAETSAGTTIYSLPDTNNPSGYTYDLEQSTTQGGALTQTFILGPTGVLAQADGSGVVRYLLTDGHGSTRQLVDSGGAVSTYYAFDAYGNPLATSIVGSITTQYLYTGQQWDPGVGQYDLRARFYDPSIGRFSSFDPSTSSISDPLALHRYIYTENDPITRIDPTGLFGVTDALMTIGASGALMATVMGAIAPAGHHVEWAVRGFTSGVMASSAIVYAATIGKLADPAILGKVLWGGLSSGLLNVIGTALGDWAANGSHLTKHANDYTLQFVEGFAWGATSAALKPVVDAVPGLKKIFGSEKVLTAFTLDFTIGFTKSAADSVLQGIGDFVRDGGSADTLTTSYWVTALKKALLDGWRAGTIGLYKSAVSHEVLSGLERIETLLGDQVFVQTLWSTTIGVLSTGLNGLGSMFRDAILNK